MTTSDPDDVIPSPIEPPLNDLTLPIVEERLVISKRRVSRGRVVVSTRTEIVEEIAEVELDRYRVEVTRIPIGRMVDEVPAARAEGDTTIIPIVEERLVLVKQLFLTEEVHIRHVMEREMKREPVMLRRQRATVKRTKTEPGSLDPEDA